MNVLIRAAESADSAELLAIENQCFTSANWGIGDFLKYECWIAELDGKVAGFLVSREVFPGDAASPPQREILNLAVAPDLRRRGVATALIEDELKRSVEVFLEVRESNAVARELYRRLGFIEVGIRPNYYQSPNETAIVMHMK